MASDRPTPDGLPKEPLARLLAVMAWLRDRQHGCPWDVDQTFKTIAPYTIEEAYEIADEMVDRHPHVFGDLKIADADAQTVSWEARKAAERASKGSEPAGALDGV